ncbi:hypothetical protein [Rhizobium sp. KDH_Rht_773_N]
MGEASDAYKLATEAGREATKQLLVVTGGMLAGYLAFMGRPETAKILDVAWAKFVIATLFLSLFLGALSLGLGYLMHAARSRFLQQGNSRDQTAERRWERAAVVTTLGAFFLLFFAILTIVVTAYC